MTTISASPALISVGEYLKTMYRPDCDYVDGRLEERNLGEFDHARLQGAILRFLMNEAKKFRVLTVPECRVQVAPTRFRIPDICCVRKRPASGIITEPPILCIEILSPEDRFSRIMSRVADYLKMGVPFVWIIDPENLQLAFIHEPGEPLREVTDGILTAGEISINLNELSTQQDFE